MLQFVVSSGHPIPVKAYAESLLARLQQCDVKASYLPLGANPSIEVSGTEREVELKPVNCQLHNVDTLQAGEKRYDAQAVVLVRNEGKNEIAYRFYLK